MLISNLPQSLRSVGVCLSLLAFATIGSTLVLAGWFSLGGPSLSM